MSDAAKEEGTIISKFDQSMEGCLMLEARIERIETCLDGLTDQLLDQVSEEKMDRGALSALQGAARLVGQLVRSVRDLAGLRTSWITPHYTSPFSAAARIYRKAKKNWRRKEKTEAEPENMKELRRVLTDIACGTEEGDVPKILELHTRMKRTAKSIRQDMTGASFLHLKV